MSEVRSIDGVLFEEGSDEIWGGQVSIDRAYSTSSSDIYIFRELINFRTKKA